MTNVIQVHTTTDSKEDAERIASQLLEARLAACIQISGPITSTYRWQGKVETAEEWLCTIKTSREVYERLEQAIRDAHRYDEPEILAVPVLAGSEGYIKWLNGEVEI